MADLEKLTILLEAQTKQFENAMKRMDRLTRETTGRAEKNLSRLDKVLSKTGAGFANFAKGAALGAIGGIGIDRLATSIGQAVKQMAELADEAKRAGVSAEDLQAVGFAAMQAGSSTEDMVDLLKKFNVEVGEAATKSNDLAKLFEANGVSLRDQNGTIRSTKDLFYEIVDLIAHAKTQQEAAVIAQMAFGKAAGDALPFLQQGAAAIKESEQNARDLGAVISNETIAKADEFDDRWSAAWAVWEANAKSAIINAYDFMVKAAPDPNQMLPGGTSGAGAIWNWMTGRQLSNPGSANSMGPGFYGGGPTPPKGPATVIPPPDSKTEKDTQKFVKSAEEITVSAEKMSAEMQAAEDSFVDFFSALASGTKPIDALRSSLMRLGDSLLRMGLTKGFELLLGALGSGGYAPGVGAGGMGFSYFGGPRASGGPVSAGVPYKVGEAGEEMFVPSSNGYIVPNHKLGSMGGGTVINVTNMPGVSSQQSSSQRDGRQVVDIINSVMDSGFGTRLQRHAPLIGAKPASKRTS